MVIIRSIKISYDISNSEWNSLSKDYIGGVKQA